MDGIVFTLIKGNVQKPIANLIINAERLTCFPPNTEKRQSCPFLPPLLKYLTSAIRQRGIKGGVRVGDIGWEGRNKIVLGHRQHYWLCRKPQRIYKNITPKPLELISLIKLQNTKSKQKKYFYFYKLIINSWEWRSFKNTSSSSKKYEILINLAESHIQNL